MMEIIAIQSVIFISYVLYVWQRFGVLSSISASSYKLKGNNKAIFTGWLVVLGISSYFLDMGLYSHLMGVGFCLAGMSTDHKRQPDSTEDEYHTAGTILAIASGFLGLLVQGVWIPTVAFVLAGLAFYKFTRNWIWWVEIAAMIAIATGYTLK